MVSRKRSFAGRPRGAPAVKRACTRTPLQAVSGLEPYPIGGGGFATANPYRAWSGHGGFAAADPYIRPALKREGSLASASTER
jgi:hypothetical protein